MLLTKTCDLTCRHIAVLDAVIDALHVELELVGEGVVPVGARCHEGLVLVAGIETVGLA